MVRRIDKSKVDLNVVNKEEEKQFDVETQLLWAKATDTAIIPTKRKEDAAYDLYCDYPEGIDNVEIAPHLTVKIPTNIHCAFSSKYVMIVKERGSNGVLGIAQRSGVVDSGYRGNIIVPLTNTTPNPIVLSRSITEVVEANGKLYYPMSKAIAQAVLVVLAPVESQEIDLKDLKTVPSQRGSGKLGSSGK